MAYLFYIDGDDIGLVVENEGGDPPYTKNDKAATLKLYGKFEESDMTTDSSSPALINARHHKALAYRVLADVIPKQSKFYLGLYMKMVRAIRSNQNIYVGNKTSRNYYF
jgi:hypothetical protein